MTRYYKRIAKAEGFSKADLPYEAKAGKMHHFRDAYEWRDMAVNESNKGVNLNYLNILLSEGGTQSIRLNVSQDMFII